MKNRVAPALMLMGLFAMACSSADTSTAKTQSDQSTLRVVKINSVYDGDTFRVDLDCDCGVEIFCKNIPIRVAGVDTPEIRGACQQEKDLAKKARDFTKAFLSRGQVTLRNIQRGKYFRIAAEVYVGSASLSQALIKEKLAVPYTGGTKTKNWCK